MVRVLADPALKGRPQEPTSQVKPVQFSLGPDPQVRGNGKQSGWHVGKVANALILFQFDVSIKYVGALESTTVVPPRQSFKPTNTSAVT